MNVVYEPKGRAREYSELACNLYRGCTHDASVCKFLEGGQAESHDKDMNVPWTGANFFSIRKHF